MGIKLENVDKTYTVSYSKRHPITRMPVTRKRKGVKSKAEAQRMYNQLVVEVEDKIRRSEVPTWEKCLADYLESSRYRGLTNRTLYGAETTLRKHTADWFGRLVDSFSPQDFNDLLQVKLAEKASSHKKYTLKCVRAVFGYALEAGYINRNPTPTMKFKVSDKIKAVLTEEQARHLLARAKELNWAWYFHYALALYTGMRNGELYALTWDKVDIESRSILINLGWTKKDGFKSTKSGDDRRIEIALPLVPILNELKRSWTDSDFVLPRLTRWDQGEQARELRLLLLGLGLPQVRFHDLRATWATILLSKGVEPIRVMKMGGWKDIATMMIYVRKAGIDIRGATDCLDFNPRGLAKVLKMVQDA